MSVEKTAIRPHIVFGQQQRLLKDDETYLQFVVLQFVKNKSFEGKFSSLPHRRRPMRLSSWMQIFMLIGVAAPDSLRKETVGTFAEPD